MAAGGGNIVHRMKLLMDTDDGQCFCDLLGFSIAHLLLYVAGSNSHLSYWLAT